MGVTIVLLPKVSTVQDNQVSVLQNVEMDIEETKKNAMMATKWLVMGAHRYVHTPIVNRNMQFNRPVN